MMRLLLGSVQFGCIFRGFGVSSLFSFIFFCVLVYSSSSVLSSNGHRQEWIYCLALAESYTITIAIWCYIFQVLCLRFVFFLLDFPQIQELNFERENNFFILVVVDTIGDRYIYKISLWSEWTNNELYHFLSWILLYNSLISRQST